MYLTRTAQSTRDGGSAKDGDAPEQGCLASWDTSDEVLVALSEVRGVLAENARRERILSGRIADFRRARMNGQAWTAILASEDEPSTVQLISTMHRRHGDASGNFRRSLAVSLRAEGESIPSIAHLFGVTHQRISGFCYDEQPMESEGRGSPRPLHLRQVIPPGCHHDRFSMRDITPPAVSTNLCLETSGPSPLVGEGGRELVGPHGSDQPRRGCGISPSRTSRLI